MTKANRNLSRNRFNKNIKKKYSRKNKRTSVKKRRSRKNNKYSRKSRKRVSNQKGGADAVKQRHYLLPIDLYRANEIFGKKYILKNTQTGDALQSISEIKDIPKLNIRSSNPFDAFITQHDYFFRKSEMYTSIVLVSFENVDPIIDPMTAPITVTDSSGKKIDESQSQSISLLLSKETKVKPEARRFFSIRDTYIDIKSKSVGGQLTYSFDFQKPEQTFTNISELINNLKQNGVLTQKSRDISQFIIANDEITPTPKELN